MRCPACSRSLTPHTVRREDGAARTLMMTETYWDEEDRLHVHDPNTTTSAYRCSNGHRFSVTARPGCAPCGDPGDQEVREL